MAELADFELDDATLKQAAGGAVGEDNFDNCNNCEGRQRRGMYS